MAFKKRYAVLTDKHFPGGVVVKLSGEEKNGCIVACMPNQAMSGYPVANMAPLPDDYVYDQAVEFRRMMRSVFARNANVVRCIEGMEKDVEYLRSMLVDAPTGSTELNELSATLNKFRWLYDHKRGAGI